jgi:O-antigen/teichoic acid export membrane protein
LSAENYQKRDYIAAILFGLTTAVRLGLGLVVIKIIAELGGPEGMGLLGQFMGVLAIVAIFSGGGISTGVTKYLAQNRSQGLDSTNYLQTALAITLYSSIFLAIAILLSASWGSRLLFGTEAYTSVIAVIAIFQIFLGFNNFSLAVMNGRKDVVGYCAATILGAFLGAIGMYCIAKNGGTDQLMLGLLVFTTSTAIFSPTFLWFRHPELRHALKPIFNRMAALKLIRFSGMQLMTVLTLPIAQIFIRSNIEDQYGWEIVGYWQGVNKISDAYLQFFLIYLANYFLPRLAETLKTEDLKRLVFDLFKIILPISIISTTIIYLTRYLFIDLLFSPTFIPMADYFTFQLIGDVFKILAYTLVFVAISRAMFKVLICAEIFQALMLVLFTLMGALYSGPTGLVAGYAVTYILYFSVALLIFLSFIKRSKLDLS